MSLLPTATSVDVAAAGYEVAVVPVGAFEQHGDHLPLTTDTLIASVIAAELADVYHLFRLPPVTITCSHEHESFAGTVSIRASTLEVLIDDIRDSLTRMGIDKLVLVNAHGGNYVLANIVQQANVDTPRLALFPMSADWRAARQAADMVTDNHDDMHAGELETSILLHALPAAVRAGFVDADHEVTDRPALLTLGMRAYTETGVIGRPSFATAEKGKAVLEQLSQSFSEVLVSLDAEGAMARGELQA